MRSLEASLEASGRQHAEGAVKTAEDLDRYRAVIAETGPRCIVETGAFSGRSALWFQQTAGCPVVTIDVHHQVDAAVIAEAGSAVTWVVGNSTAPVVASSVVALARQFADDGRVLVSLDSDHSCAHVLREMDLYSELVGPGSYMVVEDGLLRWMSAEERSHYLGTPLDAIEHWLGAHPEWEADVELEDRYEQTQHVSGWLRRRQ